MKRSAFRYTGGKWILAPSIIRHFPAHLVYIEPFGGSGSVLLRKSRSEAEIYNDLDGDVVNFFIILRERENELIRALTLTPFAESEHRLAREPADDPLERARRFYIRAQMGIAGPTAKWKSGFRRQKRVRYKGRKAKPAARSFSEIEHLHAVAGRFRGVTIESMPTLKLMQLYDSDQALFYLDPPYVSETRGRWASASYRHEMSDEDHIEFLAAVRDLRGHVVISGYRHPIYDEGLADWQRVDREARVNGAGSAVESLWLAPHTWEALQDERGGQMRLF